MLEQMLSGRLIPLPRHLTIETTSFCNLKCRMCPRTNNAVNTPPNKVMSREVFDKLLPILPSIESLELNGLWGEAFMHPDLYLYMLGEIKARGVDVYTISNGTLLTEAVARRLVELGLNRLVISLDAATAETYSKIRPPGSFDNIVQGLEHLKAWKERLGSDMPRVEFAFLGLHCNIAEFPDAVRLAARLGAYSVCLQAMGEYDLVKGESVAVHSKELGRRMFADGQRVGRELGVVTDLLPGDQFDEDAPMPGETPPVEGARKDCSDFWNKAIITTNGDVLPCCASQKAVGNLLETDFETIWYGKAYSSLRRRFISGDMPEMCKACTGMAWTQGSRMKDVKFYFSDLVARRLRHRLRRNKTARAVYHGIKRVLGRNSAGKQEQSAGEDLHARHEHTAR